MRTMKVPFSDLLGKVIVRIDNPTDENLYFHTEDGDTYRMFHEFACCEQVYIDDICGDLNDLCNSPVLLAEEVSNHDPVDVNKKRYADDSHTWTFYKLATIKGYVTIKWLGTSNGCYSEQATFVKILECEPTIKYGRN
jgi:hypothetical protein